MGSIGIEKKSRKRSKCMKIVSTASLPAMGFFLLHPADASASDNEKICSKTAKAANLACLNEVKDDYREGIGKCLNIADEVDREECTDQVTEERSEAREECAEQYEARLDVCEDLGEAAYDPSIDPDDFVDDPLAIGATVDANPYFPLKPGTVWVYEHQSSDETITVTVTSEIKEILGVNCVVVRDVVKEDGELIEDTDDWYAQDMDGNVWYFGEISRNYEDGELVDLEGSWKAARNFC